MGSCPFPYLLALLAPFFLSLFRTASRKPKQGPVKPISHTPGQYLPHQRRAAPSEPVSAP
ncbi:MAG: hypothetical protein KatS3mg061_0303 [Dehalococcoidia bacterium]|nr:MAG: hypothetical protein KatS3mg061_0303 [Dehalococcoidia bacterium]